MRKRAYKIGDLVWYLDFKAPEGDEYASRTIIVGMDEVEKRVWNSNEPSKYPHSAISTLPYAEAWEDVFTPVRGKDTEGSYRFEKYRYYRIMAGEQIITVGEYEVWKHKKRLVNSLSYRLNRQIQKSFASIPYKPPNYNQILFPQIGGIVASTPSSASQNSIVCTFEISGIAEATETNSAGNPYTTAPKLTLY